jgi:hypothetical protein
LRRVIPTVNAARQQQQQEPQAVSPRLLAVRDVEPRERQQQGGDQPDAAIIEEVASEQVHHPHRRDAKQDRGSRSENSDIPKAWAHRLITKK